MMAATRRQLVGSKCVLCQERIGSILEGEHCAQCGHPIHNKCVKHATESASEGLCPLCGSEVTRDEAAKQVQKEVKSERLAARGNYPVASVCPQCGHSGFIRHWPERWIAFAADRECKQCNTRYIPPTPTWIAIVILLVGVYFIGCTILSKFLRFASRNRDGLQDMAVDATFLLIGIPLIVYGYRCLQAPRKDR